MGINEKGYVVGLLIIAGLAILLFLVISWIGTFESDYLLSRIFEKPSSNASFVSGPITPSPTPESTVPRSKSECLGENWRKFGTFKTQGDCVSWVVSKERNPPSTPSSTIRPK